MRKVGLVLCLLLLLSACAEKKPPVAAAPPPPPPPPAPIWSPLPPSTAETIQHCVILKRENANTVTCGCVPATTEIDSRTGHTTLICKKMKEEK